MIWSALRDKLRARGPIGFAADLAELAIAGAVLAVCEVGATIIEHINERRDRCDADCTVDRTSCRNAEEAGQ